MSPRGQHGVANLIESPSWKIGLGNLKIEPELSEISSIGPLRESLGGGLRVGKELINDPLDNKRFSSDAVGPFKTPNTHVNVNYGNSNPCLIQIPLSIEKIGECKILV
jgi:hypothetical protein